MKVRKQGTTECCNCWIGENNDPAGTYFCGDCLRPVTRIGAAVPQFSLIECWRCEEAWWAEVTDPGAQVVFCPRCEVAIPT